MFGNYTIANVLQYVLLDITLLSKFVHYRSKRKINFKISQLP